MPNIDVAQALKKLKEGNQHFVTSLEQGLKLSTVHKKVTVQKPFAIILGCSDARVPAEIIFNQSLGELFVIRVAGNIVAPSQIGSVEFAIEQFNCPLVVVLGHSNCGAVNTTLKKIEAPESETTVSITSIVERIRPSVQPLFETPLKNNPQKLLQAAIHSNIRASISHLYHGSPLLENLVKQDKLSIIGAHYNIETGVVEFFDD